MRACHGPIRAAIGDAFSDDEIDDALARLEARYRRKKKMSPGADDTQTWQEAMSEVSRELLEDNLIEARLKRFSALAKGDRERAISAMVARGYDEAAAIRMFNVGEESDAPGSGASVDARGRALEAELTGELIDGLSASGAFKRLMHWTGRRDKDFERAIVREVARLNGAKDIAASTDRSIQDAAHAIRNAVARARDAQNEAGAWIRELDGYVARQSHDPVKVSGGFFKGARRLPGADTRRLSAQDGWVGYIHERLDPRSFDPAYEEQARRAARIAEGEDAEAVDPEGLAQMTDGELERQYLAGIWEDIVAGRHDAEDGAFTDLDGYRPPPGKARAASRGRVLHFKSADDWFDYNERFGRGSLMEAVLGQVRRGARNAALMRAWGPSPRASFDAHLEAAQKRLKGKPGQTTIAEKLRSRMLLAEFEQLDGTADAPESVRLAAISRGVRSWQQLAKLGGVTISAQTDTAFAANALSRAGVSYLDGYSHIYKSVLGLEGEAARGVADDLSVASLVMAGDVSGRFNALDGANGVMSRMLGVFYRANLFQFWNEKVRRGAGVAMARNLGRKAQTAFADLDAPTRGALERYGINKATWNLIRKNAQEVEEIGAVITEDAALNVDRKAAARALGYQPGKNGYSEFQMNRAARDLQNRLRAYFLDQADNAMTEPRARERAMLRAGTQSGTFAGTAVELIMQFKSFPLTVITRQINPARRGVGGQSPAAAMAHLMLASTVLGFVALQAKNILRLQKPQPLTDDEGNPNTALIMASFLQGGGAGIYGDLLMADYNRFGQGWIETLSGPSIGTMGDVLQLYSMLLDPEDRDQADSQAIRLLANNTPFANLFYVRPALNYLLLWRMQEAASPGYLERYERRLEEEQGREMLVSPDEVVNG